MKRKFFLHRQNEPMKSDTVVYRVWIGESVREQRILTKLVAWAFANGATLCSWSEAIDYWLQYEAERVFNDCGILDFGFVSTDINASEALMLAESQTWENYENNLSTPKAFFNQMITLAPSRLREAQSDTRNSMCLSPKSKYLSDGKCKDKHVSQFA